MIKGALMSLFMAVAFWFGVNLLVVPYLPFWIVVVLTVCFLGGRTG